MKPKQYSEKDKLKLEYQAKLDPWEGRTYPAQPVYFYTDYDNDNIRPHYGWKSYNSQTESYSDIWLKIAKQAFSIVESTL